MPRDRRLYMTFPIDFPDHPKVKPLTPLAKWTFVEMNAYSRRLGLDGRIPATVANLMWGKKPLADLIASHAERPLILFEGDEYIIRDYSEHQFTSEDLEDLHEKRSRAGAMGGKAKAEAKQTASKPLASATANGYQTASKSLANGKQNLAGSESRSESELETEKKTDSAHPFPVRLVGDAPADATDEEFIQSEAIKLGIKNLSRIVKAFERVLGSITEAQAIDYTRSVIDLSTTHVKAVEAYIEAACINSPEQIRQVAA